MPSNDQGEMAVLATRCGTRFATCSLTKSAFGTPTRPGADRRLEKSQNLVSTNDPEVIESLKASCNGTGMVMAEVATSAGPELFGIQGGLKGDTRLDLRATRCLSSASK